MQAALPITQPVWLPAYGVATIVLTGFMIVPMSVNPAPVTRVTLTEAIPAKISTDSGLWALTSVQELDAANEEKKARAVEAGRQSVQSTRGTLIEGSKTVQTVRVGEGVEAADAEVGVEKVELIAMKRVNTPDAVQGSSVRQEEARASIVQHALNWLGIPYAWGGESRDGIDCSALVQKVYREVGVELPRTSYEQFRTGVGLPVNQLLPGDLVFFSTNSAGASHVGIYLGEKRFISATQRQVEVQSLESYYWNKTYRGSRRVFED